MATDGGKKLINEKKKIYHPRDTRIPPTQGSEEKNREDGNVLHPVVRTTTPLLLQRFTYLSDGRGCGLVTPAVQRRRGPWSAGKQNRPTGSRVRRRVRRRHDRTIRSRGRRWKHYAGIVRPEKLAGWTAVALRCCGGVARGRQVCRDGSAVGVCGVRGISTRTSDLVRRACACASVAVGAGSKSDTADDDRWRRTREKVYGEMSFSVGL